MNTLLEGIFIQEGGNQQEVNLSGGRRRRRGKGTRRRGRGRGRGRRTRSHRY